MTARISLTIPALFLLLPTFVLAGPAHGDNQFKVRISIVSQCGPQPGPLFGSGGKFGVACLSSGTVFRAQQFSAAPSSAPGLAPGSSSGTRASGSQAVNASYGVTGATFDAPSIDSLPSGSTEGGEKIVYVVF